MINIGEYIEMAVEWLTEHGASFFDLLSLGVESVIDGILCVLLGIPFYITIAILTFLALYKSGRGTGIFTLLGLSLVYGMGFWEETMQTLALVLSSTGMALMLGIPLGIWMAGSGHCNKILQPVLDCMQTMPAFVYLIPAVLFFGLGTVPGAFATIIFALPPVARLTALASGRCRRTWRKPPALSVPLPSSSCSRWSCHWHCPPFSPVSTRPS